MERDQSARTGKTQRHIPSYTAAFHPAASMHLHGSHFWEELAKQAWLLTHEQLCKLGKVPNLQRVVSKLVRAAMEHATLAELIWLH
jgi:hypothetical protein